MFSDESQIVLDTNNRVYIWRQDDEKYKPHLICSRFERFALKFNDLGMYLL